MPRRFRDKAYVMMRKAAEHSSGLSVRDQLEETELCKGFIDWPGWLRNVYGFNYGNRPNGHLHIFTTWEQLWLAFTMKERFNKVWNGEDWEGEKK